MDMDTLTTTRLRIPSAALRWLEVNWQYLGAIAAGNPQAPVIQAAAREYRQKFDRDLERDISKMPKVKQQ